MKKTVLVHVISNLGIGGAEAVLYQLLCRLDMKQFDHKVIYFYDGPYVQKIRELGIPVYQVKGLVSPYDPLFLSRFFSLIKKLQPDCVHTVLWAANLLGRIAAWKYKFPLVQALHNNQDQNGFLRRFIDRFSPKVSGPIVAVSEGVGHSVAVSTPWVNSQRMCVIKNGIDVEEVRLRAALEPVSREDLGLSPDHFVIGTVGRFEPVKNYAFLLTAFAVLYDKYRTERLVLLGQGSQEHFLKRRAYYLGIDEHVMFITGQPAYKYYLLFDCFVMTSYKEGLSMALLEAMSMGIACIVTSSELQHDVLVHEENGFLIPAGNPQFLADALDRLAQDPALRMRLGNAAKITIEQRFRVDSMVNGYTEIYQKAMAERGGSKPVVKRG
jgi:glycosyltransferase involved in cell wall biosynthesis